MSRRNSPVPDWIPPDLPAAPGVYQFQDAVGTPIYVGKSVNLRRRVRGYFYGGGPKDERMALMVRLARMLMSPLRSQPGLTLVWQNFRPRQSTKL